MLYNKLKDKVKNLFYKENIYEVKYNVNGADENKYKKRALLIYLITPFLLKENDIKYLYHQNLTQCKQIAQTLGEAGYIVDVTDIRNNKFKSLHKYDLLLSHRKEINDIGNYFNENCKNLFLATGLNKTVHNENLKKRINNLENRRSIKLNIPMYSEYRPYLKRVQAIISFGNCAIGNTWKGIVNCPVYTFNNYGFKNTKFIKKDYNKARYNFLFLGSNHQVSKGLDLLLEIFPKHSNLNLYICSRFKADREFCRIYNKELYKTKNIKPVGWIIINSKEFYNLVKKCAYVILPSCAEGQPGSVVQCMHTGMIPVVTKECGIDTEDFGITFKNDSIEEIEKVVLELCQKQEDWCKEKSIKTKKIAESKYSEEAFVNRWREILKEINI